MDEESTTLNAAEKKWILLHGEQSRLGIGCLILHFKETGSFPKKRTDISSAIVESAALTLGSETEDLCGYIFGNRSHGRHLSGIREFLGIRWATNEDACNAESHLKLSVLSDFDASDLEK